MERLMMIVSGALVLAILLLIARAKWLSVGDRRGKALDFAAALVATFCGVALAISGSNAVSERQERAVVTELLRAADYDVLQACGQMAFYADQDTVFSPKLSDSFVMATRVPVPLTCSPTLVWFKMPASEG